METGNRRVKADMVQTYKIVHELDRLKQSDMFTMINEGVEHTRVTRLRSDSLNNSYLQRVVKWLLFSQPLYDSGSYFCDFSQPAKWLS